jgi:DNA-binding NarL/FixJ family response regulator
MAAPASEVIRDELVRIAQVGLDRHEFARAAMRVLRRAVPFDGAAVVWFDPSTALPVDQWLDNSVTASADIDGLRELAASGRRAASMGQARDELRAVCVGDSGLWGAIVLHRGAPSFMAREVSLLASLSRGFEEVQRLRLQRDLSVDAGTDDHGLLVLDDEDDIEMADTAAEAWLDELRANAGRLPLVVTAVADRARAIASGHSDGKATARVRTRSGRWVLVRGSVLANGTHSRTAVTLRPAQAPELAELIADAHGLTARERRVTELVAQGLTSAAIAARLYLSTYTVQDHLKAIFEKLQVSSRGELVARLFVDHSLGRSYGASENGG